MQEGMVRLATWMPFRQASEQLEFFMGTAVGATTIRETTEQAGQAQVQLQDQRVAALQADCPPSPPGPEVQLLSVDGAFLHLVGGEWKEVKTLAVGTVGAPVEKDGEQVVHTTDLSYFSRMSEAKAFERQALVEIHERGVEKAGVVCAVSDGAEWIQRFVDLHRPNAVRILDFAHATEKVAEVGHTIDEQGLSLSCLKEKGEQKRAKPNTSRKRKAGAKPNTSCPSAQPRATSPDKACQTEAQLAAEQGKARLQAWLDGQTEELKKGEAALVVQEIERLWLRMQAEGRAKVAEAIATRLNYLKERQSMISYATFRQQGYPIGSGSVESANKLVVESRMKGSGMRWSEEHVDPMLALRNAACSNRWRQVWKQIRQQWLHQTQAQRACNSAKRLLERQPQTEQDLPESALMQKVPLPKPIPAGQKVESVGAVRKVAGPASPTLEVPPPAESSSSGQQKPKAPSTGGQRPASTHPWRRPFLRERPAS
jgi:hypothetical protein